MYVSFRFLFHVFFVIVQRSGCSQVIFFLLFSSIASEKTGKTQIHDASLQLNHHILDFLLDICINNCPS